MTSNRSVTDDRGVRRLMHNLRRNVTEFRDLYERARNTRSYEDIEDCNELRDIIAEGVDNMEGLDLDPLNEQSRRPTGPRACWERREHLSE